MFKVEIDDECGLWAEIDEKDRIIEHIEALEGIITIYRDKDSKLVSIYVKDEDGDEFSYKFSDNPVVKEEKHRGLAIISRDKDYNALIIDVEYMDVEECFEG